jgi:hypothetical protein
VNPAQAGTTAHRVSDTIALLGRPPRAQGGCHGTRQGPWRSAGLESRRVDWRRRAGSVLAFADGRWCDHRVALAACCDRHRGMVSAFCGLRTGAPWTVGR